MGQDPEIGSPPRRSEISSGAILAQPTQLIGLRNTDGITICQVNVFDRLDSDSVCRCDQVFGTAVGRSQDLDMYGAGLPSALETGTAFGSPEER